MKLDSDDYYLGVLVLILGVVMFFIYLVISNVDEHNKITTTVDSSGRIWRLICIHDNAHWERNTYGGGMYSSSRSAVIVKDPEDRKCVDRE